MSFSSIDVLVYFIGIWVGCVQGELHRLFRFRRSLLFNLRQQFPICHFAPLQLLGPELYRVPMCLPVFFLLLRAIIRAVDITDVMAIEPVCFALEKRRPATATR